MKQDREILIAAMKCDKDGRRGIMFKQAPRELREDLDLARLSKKLGNANVVEHCAKELKASLRSGMKKLLE